MAAVGWTTRAREELAALADGFARFSPRYAQAFEAGVAEATRRLEMFPRSGRIVPEIGDDAMREVIYRGYRIIYFVSEDGAEVRVLTVYPASRPLGNLR